MTEPRARPRQKGQVFSSLDLSEVLFAFGDPVPHQHSLPTTISVLDEILTDFIIESCHAAALCASYSRRQKIKAEDFKWVLRGDERLLGRVYENAMRERNIKDARKTFGGVEKEGKEGLGDLATAAELGGAADDIRKVGKGKGRRKKRKAEDLDGGLAGHVDKRSQT